MLNSRNCLLDILRLFFCIVIVLHHANLLKGGYLAVEYFFILSGFYLYKKYHIMNVSNFNDMCVISCVHVFKAIKKIYVVFIVSSVLSFIFYSLLKEYKGQEFDSAIVLIINGFFFVQSFGIPVLSLTGVEWFLSSYFFVIFVLIPIILKYKHIYIIYYAPIFILCIYGFIISRHGHLVAYCMDHEFISAGMLRAFADIMVGCLCFELCVYLKNNFGYFKYYRYIGIFFAVLSIFFIIIWKDNYMIDFIFIVSASCTIISLNADIIEFKYYLGQISSFCKTFSVVLFLNHFPYVQNPSFLDSFPFFLDSHLSGKRNAMIFASFILSLIVILLVKLLKRSYAYLLK